MKHTILVVDDEVDNVDALERLFRRKYNVIKATSGRQALKALEDSNVSLIVTDQRMPNMTGVEFLAESMESHPHAIRILLTGFTDIDSVISAINSGQNIQVCHQAVGSGRSGQYGRQSHRTL
ncbi:MAG: response regulator [Bdellovibrionaceae bacterium]|nr:response regulator [Pseudobdellovibrionaceae bacterium]